MSFIRIVRDRYRIVRPIGRSAGGGVVYVANDRQQADAPVAIKLIPTGNRLAVSAVRQFVDEAKAPSNALAHQGVVKVIDAGFEEAGPSLYLVMELLHGESLRDAMNRGASTDELIDWVGAALPPLAAIHGRGFVHGGLKPSNVFIAHRLQRKTEVTLLDIDLNRVLSQFKLTAGVDVVSPRYMAPELLQGQDPSPRADVYAIGAMMYEACAGKPPYSSGRITELLKSIQEDDFPSLAKAAPTADPAIVSFCEACLAKDPASRPADGRALTRLLSTLRGGAGVIRTASGESAISDTVMDLDGAGPAPPPERFENALRQNPRDPAVHRGLFSHYKKSSIADGTWLAASALSFLRSATPEEDRVHHHYRRPEGSIADKGLDGSGWALIRHPDQDERIDAIWSECGAAIHALYRRTDEQLGLGKLKKVAIGRDGGELAAAFAQAVAALRPTALPRLYQGKAGIPPRHLAAHPPASVFPTGFEEPLADTALLFAVGRHVAYYRPAHRVCTILHDPDALETMFYAALRVGLGWPAQTPDEAKVSQLLDHELGEGKRASLRAACARLGAQANQVDLGSWRRAVELTCCRAGLLLAADLDGSEWMLRWLSERRRIPSEDAINDLLGFWTSVNHLRTRHRLGLNVVD